jgi:hypothetical protein
MEVRSVEAIFSALNAADVKYLVVGGLAVNAYGYERLTRAVVKNGCYNLPALFGVDDFCRIPFFRVG